MRNVDLTTTTKKKNSSKAKHTATGEGGGAASCKKANSSLMILANMENQEVATEVYRHLDTESSKPKETGSSVERSCLG